MFVRGMQIWVVVMVVWEIYVSWLPGFALQILQQNHVQILNSLGIKTWESMENAGSKPENHNDPFQTRNRIKWALGGGICAFLNKSMASLIQEFESWSKTTMKTIASMVIISR